MEPQLKKWRNTIEGYHLQHQRRQQAPKRAIKWKQEYFKQTNKQTEPILNY
jgi:hypothetical protein